MLRPYHIGKMARILVIVESPAKAKTIGRILGGGYVVRASMGHVRDLPAKQLGVELERDFRPTYHLVRIKSKTIGALRDALEGAGELYLATDPDREGEAIAWHLLQVLKPGSRPVRRVAFHELTEAAIQAAFAHPRGLDMDLVNAQQARRILDRLVGYQVSPLLWHTTGGKSAGRVQSVALRMVVEREREIAAFIPEEYWSIHAHLAKPADHAGSHFWARLVKLNGKKVGLHETIDLKTREEAEHIIADLEDAEYRVKSVQREEKKRYPWPPFTTSTLQQAASARLRMSPAETMKIAQELYEGVDIGQGKPVGLITYMRTDSTAVAPEAQAAARELIREMLGERYLPPTPPQYKTKVKNAQEAHEAIRPTGVRRTPDALKAYLTERQHRVYDLVWRRFLASQMAPAVYDVTTVDVEAIQETLKADFRAVGRVLLFDGFLRVWEEAEEKADDEDEAQALPELAAGELLDLLELLARQHFTKPPPRYTEASLIKALEKLGIGRPSTYASIVATLKDRQYVRLEKRYLYPTPLGEATCDALVAAFPEQMDYGFTAQMEDRLDEVSRGERDWVAMLREFYTPFSAALGEAKGKMQGKGVGSREVRSRKKEKREGKTRGKRESNKTAAQTVDVACPLCGAPMVARSSKYGPFLGCSTFPACKGTRKIGATL
ncbi:MAG: type I DNA topoisomerase [Thermoflexales bacterium]|nr:type I DNA topoisomerase [Thermoflexales bacterium]